MERPQAESGYIPTLDGWRTVAIAAVLISHSNFTMTSLGFSRQAISVAAWGRLGVDLFFAISGYLICGRLLAEQEAAGGISLKNFYIRRLFRILPLYYGYLAVLVALAVFAGVALTKTEIVSSIFFFRNYVPMSAGDYTNHFWSLAVEEHFYLFWPFFLVAVGPRAALWTTPILALSVHIWRAVDSRRHLFPTVLSEAGILHRTDTRIDAILWGCVAALLCAKYPRLIFPGWVAWSVLFTLFGAIAFAAPALPLLLAVLFPCLIVSTSRSPRSSMARILEWGWMRWLGRLSYGMYVWQTLFLQHGAIPDPAWLARVKIFPIDLAIIFVCSIASYYLLERPMIRLGRKAVRRFDRPSTAVPEPTSS